MERHCSGGTCAAGDGAVENGAEAKRQVAVAVECVETEPANTAAICRRCYIHREVSEAYMDGSLAGLRRRGSRRYGNSHFSAEERDVLSLLRRRAAAAAKQV